MGAIYSSAIRRGHLLHTPYVIAYKQADCVTRQGDTKEIAGNGIGNKVYTNPELHEATQE